MDNENSIEDDDVPVDDTLGDDTTKDDGADFVPAELKVHIGKNVFAVAKKQYASVDLRHHFFTNNLLKSLHPTRKGINMSSTEFSKLISHIPALEKKWVGLEVLKECSQSHLNEMAMMKCTHCTPHPNNNVKDGATKKSHEDEMVVDDYAGSKKLSTPSKSSSSGRKRPATALTIESSDEDATEGEEEEEEREGGHPSSKKTSKLPSISTVSKGAKKLRKE
jgi:hypothetical protein